jgi:hypothetical protein
MPPLYGVLTADSGSDAWMIWTTGGPYVNVWHWTHGAWHGVNVPDNDLPGLNLVAFAASSPRNVWMFQEYPQNVAVRYNGTHWVKQSMPAWVIDPAHASDMSVEADAVSSSSVWVFNTYDPDIPGSPQAHYASLYNGHEWTKMNLPGVPYLFVGVPYQNESDALATNDIWVLGATDATSVKPQPAWIMMHWNGKSWSSMAIPRPATAKGDTIIDDSPVGVTSRNFWLEQLVTNKQQRVVADYLLNWNGKRWQRTKAPVELGPLAEDGHGGIWTAGGGSDTQYYFYDYSAGHWTRYKAPVLSDIQWASPEGLAWIPGGRSMWAWDQETYSGDEPSSTVGVVSKYGP